MPSSLLGSEDGRLESCQALVFARALSVCTLLDLAASEVSSNIPLQQTFSLTMCPALYG
jgi:hypothetical protein